MLHVRNNVAQVAADGARNPLKFVLPGDMKYELISLGAPRAGHNWVRQIFLIESLTERMIGAKGRDGADIDATAR